MNKQYSKYSLLDQAWFTKSRFFRTQFTESSLIKKSLLKIFCTLSLLTNSLGTLSASPSFAQQSSNHYKTWNFDFVELFDDLKEWRATLGPEVSDGKNTPWYFSLSHSLKHSQTSLNMNIIEKESSIDTSKKNDVWRGTKSATLDMQGLKGPSQLALYLGDGYSDVYVFFMLHIPKNAFPTSCAGGNCQNGALGTYIEGEPYTWFSSWPLLSFNVDCPYFTCRPNNKAMEHSLHIKHYDYGLTPGLMLSLQDANQANELWAIDGNMNLDNRIGHWFALELHISQTDTETRYTIWAYNQIGNTVALLEEKSIPITPESQGKKMNRIAFGAQDADTYTWGASMRSEYYIDDVIIDDKRIGPKYFKIINTRNNKPESSLEKTTKTSAPKAPSGFMIKLKSTSR